MRFRWPKSELALVLLSTSALSCVVQEDFVFLAATREHFDFGNPEYYVGIKATDSQQLRDDLHEKIRGHLRFPYEDTWRILETADEEAGDPNRVLDFYQNLTYEKQKQRSGSVEAQSPTAKPTDNQQRTYEREHLWPKSLGFAEDNKGNSPFTDCHALVIADTDENRARSNRPFRVCDESATVRDINGGRNRVSGEGCSGRWEVWLERRGDVARAIFYMDVRYEGGNHPVANSQEPDLIVTNNADQIRSFKENRSKGYMGDKDVLLAWHKADPVDERERHRNNVISAYQGNRNPFIDHPEWVTCVYENRCDEEATQNNRFESAGLEFTEIHYDNRGKDQNEFVEISGPPGTALDGYYLIAYNGSDGVPYHHVPLKGEMPDSGAMVVEFSDLQNGHDGVAIVAPDGRAIVTLAYKDSFVGKLGPAAGVTFQDIGVFEDGRTQPTESLQIIDGKWQYPRPNTRGKR